MPGGAAAVASSNYADCSGCSLCLLVCPVWRRTRDLQFSPHGRAKALQHGAGTDELSESVRACTLCSACEPVCPEEIGLVQMVLDLRLQLPDPPTLTSLRTRMAEQPGTAISSAGGLNTALLPGALLAADRDIVSRVNTLLGTGWNSSLDDGSDIALALEAGVAIPSHRLELFLAPLRPLKRLVVADGLLMKFLRQRLPRVNVCGLGEALSSVPAVRSGLRATDMYVIEPRAYHADYQRLVGYYDSLQSIIGFATNLDLQRIAIPATARGLTQMLSGDNVHDGAQANWILRGRSKVKRIVVESIGDREVFPASKDVPVVHVSEVASLQHRSGGDS